MVPNITNGRGFGGAWLYFFHDKREEGEAVRLTDERVEWTHTLNCASDDPQLAMKEMRSTVDNQQLLKQEAGYSTRGRPTVNVLKTVSLAWEPSQDPSKEEMLDAAQSYLKHMGWQDHQIAIACHSDTNHKHLHILVNRVHPETGLTLDDRKDQPRSQEWAYQYEQEHGKIYCQAREAKYGRGEAVEATGVPHQTWEAWKQHSKGFETQLEVQKQIDAHEWDILKQIQRDERDAFRDESKQIMREARHDAYKEVREAFKDEWRDYYKTAEQPRETDCMTHRNQLAAAKADIVERQKFATERMQEEAMKGVVADRADAYQEMLARHRDEKRDLTADQKGDITRYDLLAQAYPNRINDTQQRQLDAMADREFRPLFDRGGPAARGLEPEPRPGGLFEAEDHSVSRPGGAGPRAPSKDAMDSLGGSGLSFLGGLADSLTGTTPAEPRDVFFRMRQEREAVEDAQAIEARNRQAQRDADQREEERQRDRERYRERDRER